MSAYRSHDEEFKQREQELREREMALRLRELEAELAAQKKQTDTQTHTEPDSTTPLAQDTEALAWQRKLRAVKLISKFIALAVGVAVTAIVVSWLTPLLIAGAFGYGAYILFIKEKPKASKK